MQRTNSQISFAQQIDKVRHFNVHSVASSVTSYAHGKYHNRSDSKTDDSNHDESYNDSNDTELDEENSANHRTLKAQNDVISNFIIQNKVGDVLKGFLVGNNTGGGSLSCKRNSSKYQ